MMPRQSILLKILLPLIVFVTLWLVLRPSAKNVAGTSPSRTVAALTPQELRDLGIDGDTPADTVATLVGQMKQYRRELKTIQSTNENQQARDKALKAQQATLASELRNDIRRQQDQLHDELLKSQQGLLDKLGQMSQQAPHDIPPGLGLTPGELPADVQPEIRWLEPLDAPPAMDDKLLRVQIKPTEKPQPKPDVKVYTLPQNATLTGSVAMTALIGRVPLTRQKASHDSGRTRLCPTNRCAMPGSTPTAKPACTTTCSATMTRKSGGLSFRIRLGLKGEI